MASKGVGAAAQGDGLPPDLQGGEAEYGVEGRVDPAVMFGQGLYQLFHPLVMELNGHIESVFSSQEGLAVQLDALSKELERFNQAQTPALEPHIEKLQALRKRVSSIGSHLDRVYSRLDRMTRSYSNFKAQSSAPPMPRKEDVMPLPSSSSSPSVQLNPAPSLSVSTVPNDSRPSISTDFSTDSSPSSPIDPQSQAVTAADVVETSLVVEPLVINDGEVAQESAAEADSEDQSPAVVEEAVEQIPEVAEQVAEVDAVDDEVDQEVGQFDQVDEGVDDDSSGSGTNNE
ncbi:MAG: hypothetical protein Q8P67_22035 [archaeon]|nr:hypothetical protein [archaeon]